MKLSILICTIPERKEKFEALMKELERQVWALNVLDLVEVWHNSSPKGSITIGAKRQGLLNLAKGDYVCFIDDDDNISEDYIREILEAIDLGPDCVGFKIHCDMEGKSESAASSLKYKKWDDNKDGYRYVRSIYHKTPVKREIALKVGFPNKSFSEDHDYSMGLQPFLKTEIFIDKVLYYYNYKFEDPKTKYGI